jgi:hypothetical protein
MPAFPEDLYDCLAAALFRGKAHVHMELSQFSHGLHLYSSETRLKERRGNARDIVRLRQTCKAMLGAVRALEQDEFRASTNAFWKSVFAGPTEYFVLPSTSDVLRCPWVTESHVQALKYEGKEVMKLYTKRQPRMLKLVFSASSAKTCPKIVFRIGEAPGDGESGSDSDEFLEYTLTWTRESELASAAKEWLVKQREAHEAKQAKAVRVE